LKVEKVEKVEKFAEFAEWQFGISLMVSYCESLR
jgi:hypothetical protein